MPSTLIHGTRPPTAIGVAFTRWIADGEQRSLAAIEQAVLGELAAMATGLATAVVSSSPS